MTKLRITAMAVKPHQVNGRDWGWFSREDQRMHLQTVDVKGEKVKYWLEDVGVHCCKLATGKQTAKEQKNFEQTVSKQRYKLDFEWICSMIEKEWLEVAFDNPVVSLISYPNSNSTFVRRLDLTKEFPGAYPKWKDSPPNISFDLDHCALVVGNSNLDPDSRNHFDLTKLIFI